MNWMFRSLLVMTAFLAVAVGGVLALNPTDADASRGSGGTDPAFHCARVVDFDDMHDRGMHRGASGWTSGPHAHHRW